MVGFFFSFIFILEDNKDINLFIFYLIIFFFKNVFLIYFFNKMDFGN